MHTLLRDIRYALRTFFRTPGLTLLAVTTLALGIGANAAIFSVIENVLISPYPYPNADRVVVTWRQNKALGNVVVSPYTDDIERWRGSSVLESIATYEEDRLILTGGEEPVSLKAVLASPNLTGFTGTAPLLGRTFTQDDAASESAARVVLLSEGLWKRRFGADPSVVGRSIELSDATYEIVGVLPSSFRLPLTRAIDIVAPLAPAAPPKKGAPAHARSHSAIARLKPGVSLAAAEQALTATGIASAGPSKGWSAKLMPPSELAGDTLRRALFVLLGAVGCVLLIGCANVANLLLARNAGRRREFAMRVALGASRWRLTRQLLTENLLLAVAGGALGVAAAMWAVDAISAVAPPQLQQLASITVSREVFAVSLALSVLTGLVFGLLPALSATRLSLTESLKQGSRAFGGGRGTITRRVLTVAEIALALVLLAGAGLLMRSYSRVLAQDLGFQSKGLLTVSINLPSSRYPTQATKADFAERFADLVRATPGVTHSVLASGVPPKDGMIFGRLHIEGQETPADAPPSMFGGGMVRPGFFEALQIPVKEGRGLAASDTKTASVVVNEGTARRYWPGESAIGKRLRLDATGPWHTIIGVVGDVKSAHGGAGQVQIYLPLGDAAEAPEITLLVGTSGAPSEMIPSIKAQAWTLDPKLPLGGVETLDAALAEGNARPRFNTILLGVFAALGLLLATIGVYGVISHSVGLRTQEIGVRMALGARPADIRRAVLREALLLSLAGTAVGVGVALLVGKALAQLLFGMSPADLPTLAIVAVVLGSTSLLAAWLPARRAMRVDPMVALRAD
jgi:putative ABC transport system permease protein